IKTMMLTNLSHDVRTPLAAIAKVATDLEREVPEAQHMLTRKLAETGRRLTSSLNEILHLSSLDASNFKLTIEPMLLRTVLQTVADLYRTLAEEKGLYLHVEVTEEKFEVLADHNALQQVLGNLI